MVGVQVAAEAIWALSSVLLKNSSIYPLDNTFPVQKSWRKQMLTASKHMFINIDFVGWVMSYGLVMTIPNQLLYEELSFGSYSQRKQKKWFKDCIKEFTSTV